VQNYKIDKATQYLQDILPRKVATKKKGELLGSFSDSKVGSQDDE